MRHFSGRNLRTHLPAYLAPELLYFLKQSCLLGFFLAPGGAIRVQPRLQSVDLKGTGLCFMLPSPPNQSLTLPRPPPPTHVMFFRAGQVRLLEFRNAGRLRGVMRDEVVPSGLSPGGIPCS